MACDEYFAAILSNNWLLYLSYTLQLRSPGTGIKWTEYQDDAGIRNHFTYFTLVGDHKFVIGSLLVMTILCR